jgi:hypothetical protein
MTALKALEKNPTYENFEARCPHCKYWNIFNRASDLKTFRLISGAVVICQNDNCKGEFWIGGDLINPAWQMILRDSEVLKEQKRYAHCILNLAQAFEIYFALFLRVRLIHNPFKVENSHDLERCNELSQRLFNTIRDWTFSPLRKAFIALLIQQNEPNTLAESEVIINNLPSYLKDEPSDEAITALADHDLSEILLELKQCKVSSLRNNVVHKDAYRPTLEEVDKAIEETSHILYRIERCLGVLSEPPYI